MLYLIALFVLAGLLLFVPLPIPPTYFGRTIENAGHTAAVLPADARRAPGPANRPALLRRTSVRARRHGRRGRRIAERSDSEDHWRATPPGKTWSADALGVVLALAVYAMFERRSPLRRWHRVSAFVIALGCVAIFLVPIVRMARAYVHRNAQFPVLADFHSRMELYWTVGIGVNRFIIDDALAVEFGNEEFPGVSFHEPVPDWRGFKTLLIDVENPDSRPLELVVRVHDRRHTRAFVDRYNKTFWLEPGERRTLRIALEDILHGPRHRVMDMAHISDITLFKGARGGSPVLHIYTLKLE